MSDRHPKIFDVVPELVEELQRLLKEEGEIALTDQVARLVIVDLCRCGDDFCSTFYTKPRPNGPFGPEHRTIALMPKTGCLNVDVVGSEIVQIEILFRDDLKARIQAAAI